MASSTLIPLTEYLNTTYRPDCDYIDGEVRERNVGIRPHSDMLGILCYLIHKQTKPWGVRALPSVRVQVSPTRILVPDVAVTRRTDPTDNIVHTPPLICIEVLSPRDTLSSMQERIDDYTRMGVEHIWLIDPITRHAYVAAEGTLLGPSNNEFTVPGTPIRIPLTEVFTELDDLLTQG